MTGNAVFARLLVIAVLCVTASAASAQSIADFYKARGLSIYIGYGPGGGYDLYSRLLARYIGKYLPGQPNVIPRNEPGAGSFKLANELFNALPKDGSVVGMIGDAAVISQVLGDPAAKFSAENFNWIGRLADSDPVLVSRAGASATVKEALSKEILVGVPGAGSATTLNLTVLNGLYGAKFKLVSGYEGSSQIRLALERGEVDGSASMLWRIDRDWIRERKLNVVYQASLDAAPDLAGVPRLIDLARDDEERQLLRFFSSYTTLGRAILAPPNIPQDRVKALRTAFNATMKDAAFLAEAEKAKLEINAASGEEIAALVNEVTGLSVQLREKAKTLTRVKAN